MKRKVHRRGEKKPVSVISVMAAAIGGITLLVFIFALLFMAGIEGSMEKVMAGISVMSMLLAIAAFYIGFHHYKNDNFDTVSRGMGLVIPAIAMICWIILYIIGILMG